MEKKTFKIKFFAIFSFAILYLGIFPIVAHAADITFSPSFGSHEVGTDFIVSIYISSADQAINAASGVISFPLDKLEVASLSKTGSIFSLWVQEPSFSNSDGTIKFEGIVLNPGFTGSSGKAITLTFRTKAAGNAPLTFSSGSILANDGKGTNILTEIGDANFAIGVAVPGTPEIITPAEAVGVPKAPEISSLTHPDSNKWYALKDAKFTWELPLGVTGVRLLVGKTPNAVPTVTYIPPIKERELTNLKDGIWYFSAQLRNSAGWGAISSFRFQIDTESPQLFETSIDNGGDPTNPAPILHFKAIDNTSRIEFYEVRIGERQDIIPVRVARTVVVSDPYITPPQAPGKHTVVLKAVDAANNETFSALDYYIKPLETLVITEHAKELQSGEPLVVKGTSQYPDSQIVAYLQQEGKDAVSYSANADSKGDFIFVAEERPRDGIYKFWAEVVDERGARSLPSEKETILVKRSAFLQIGSWAVSLLAVAVPLAALIFILLFIIRYGWHKCALLRKKSKNLRKGKRAKRSRR